MKNWFAIGSCILALTACGGGGGSPVDITGTWMVYQTGYSDLRCDNPADLAELQREMQEGLEDEAHAIGLEQNGKDITMIYFAEDGYPEEREASGQLNGRTWIDNYNYDYSEGDYIDFFKGEIRGEVNADATRIDFTQTFHDYYKVGGESFAFSCYGTMRGYLEKIGD